MKFMSIVSGLCACEKCWVWEQLLVYGGGVPNGAARPACLLAGLLRRVFADGAEFRGVPGFGKCCFAFSDA